MTQTTDTLIERLEITQEDREAAALIILSRDAVKRVRDGQYDRNPVVQAFACHRLSALRSTAKEVDRLRGALQAMLEAHESFDPDDFVDAVAKSRAALTLADPA